MQPKKMAHLRNCSTIRGIKDIKNISSLSLTPEERDHLNSIADKKAMVEYEKRERARFARQDTAITKYQKSYYKARDRLAAIINKNRRLMELRRELQYNRKEKNNYSNMQSSDNLRNDGNYKV